MWHVKKELFDLVFNDLDHALGSMEDIAPAGGQYWPYSPNDDDDDVPNGLAAISKVPAAGWGQILAYMAFCEVSQDQSPGTPAAAGDFGFKVLTSSDPAEKTKKLSAELANGRLAMIAIIGMFFQAQSQPIEHCKDAWVRDIPQTLCTSFNPPACFASMASNGRVVTVAVGAAGAVALCSTAFVAPSAQTKSLRATRAAEAASVQPAARASSSALSVRSGAASAALALGALSQRVVFKGSPQQRTVALKAFESELGVPFALFRVLWSVISGCMARSIVNALVSISLSFYGIRMRVAKACCEAEDLPSLYESPEEKLIVIGSLYLAMPTTSARCITPEVIGKLPGFLSPSTGLKFADIPNALAAVAKVPVAGWAQIAAYFGFVEFSGGFDDYKSGTPGDYGFKVLTSSDPAEKTKKLSAELANGRLAMMAIIGMITGKFPGYLSPSAGLKFADIPNGLAAVSKIPGWGIAQILAYMAFCEVSQDQSRGTPAAAGDFGFKVLTSSDPAARTKKLQSELANGRLAMMAIIGMFFQDGLTGSAWGDWANYTASPLRAFENELGVQPPLGFWDPLGFTADGDVNFFERRRQITGKFPGYLSPSAGLKFADIPNGLAAVSKIPGWGIAQILAYMAFCEVSQDQSRGTPAAAGDFGFKVLTSSDPAARTKKLQSELANGRLAMMAIIGMFFQDGLTGSAWGDWANYTASPLRAFENELGVQDPVGFWDSAGFTADGSVENFKRRRQTELKHGRISMLATMGYITPERLR
eukprot:s2545_g1.t1